MQSLNQIYQKLYEQYRPQGWWPTSTKDKYIPQYNNSNRKLKENEMLEICIGSILTQNTQWYPNVVRSLVNIRIGRPLTNDEWRLIEEAEIHTEKISVNTKKIIKNEIFTQNTSWQNVEKALININKEILELDKLEGAYLKSPSVVYSLILRLRGLFLINCIKNKEKYYNKNFKAWLLKTGLNKSELNKIIKIYKLIKNGKISEEKIKISTLETLLNLLGKGVIKLKNGK